MAGSAHVSRSLSRQPGRALPAAPGATEERCRPSFLHRTSACVCASGTCAAAPSHPQAPPDAAAAHPPFLAVGPLQHAAPMVLTGQISGIFPERPSPDVPRARPSPHALSVFGSLSQVSVTLFSL